MSRGQSPLIIGDLDVYPLDLCQIGVPTPNSEEPPIVISSWELDPNVERLRVWLGPRQSAFVKADLGR